MIIIDPGHGGVDPGAIFREWREKDINLSVAKKLQRLDPARYLLSRETDIAMTLQKRAMMGATAQAFISLHCNMTMTKDGRASGFETWIWKDGKDLAHLIEIPTLKNRGVKVGQFYVLRKTACPAVLVEMGFLDSPIDREFLLHSQHLIAQAVHQAVLSWRDELPTS